MTLKCLLGYNFSFLLFISMFFSCRQSKKSIVICNFAGRIKNIFLMARAFGSQSNQRKIIFYLFDGSNTTSCITFNEDKASLLKLFTQVNFLLNWTSRHSSDIFVLSEQKSCSFYLNYVLLALIFLLVTSMQFSNHLLRND